MEKQQEEDQQRILQTEGTAQVSLGEQQSSGNITTQQKGQVSNQKAQIRNDQSRGDQKQTTTNVGSGNQVQQTSSFGNQQRNTSEGLLNQNLSEQRQVPGPGAYDVNSKNSQSAAKFGTSGREGQMNQNPGPGTYESSEQQLQSKGQVQGKSFGNQPRNTTSGFYDQDQNQLSQIPGPGQYTNEGGSSLNNQSSAAKFGSSQRDGQVNNNPGPGAYDNASPQKQVTQGYNQTTFSKEGRDTTQGFQNSSSNQQQSNPGPGQYSTSGGEGLTNNSQSAAKFGTSKREDNINQNPGPGSYQYSQPTSGQNATTFSNQQRDTTQGFGNNQKQSSDMPGPGQYDYQEGVNKTKNNATSAKFGTSQREDNVNPNPGPGSYDYDQKQNSGFTMSSGRGQNLSNQVDQVPGPGQYNHQEGINQTKNNSSGVKFGTSQREDNISPNPGPGSYEYDQKQKGGFTISSGRAQNQSNQADQVPGPGQYDHQEGINQAKSNSTAAKFGTSQREDNISPNPGPGSYDYDQKQKGGFTISSSGRGQTSSNQTDQVPGPGQYDYQEGVNQTKSNPSGVKFGTSQREDNISPNPGPGSYDYNQQQKGGFTMSSGRPQNTSNQNDQVPGPGQYNHQEGVNQTKSNSATVKFGTSQREDNINPNPGPGSYDYDQKQKGGFTMGSGRPQTASNQIDYVPGPGQYDQNQRSINSAKVGSNQGSMSKAQRQNLASKDQIANPGPGMYESSTSASGSKFKSPTAKFGTQKRETMGKDNQLPGPGNYTIDAQSRSGGFKMGQKQNQKMNDNPGPGQYDPSDSKVKNKPTAHKIGTSSRQNNLQGNRSNSEIPGPGNYDLPNKNKNTAFTFGGKHKQQQNPNPGPGQYDVQDSPTKSKTQAFKMGSGKRQTMGSQTTRDQPGPGNYDLKSQDNSKMYSFGGKQQTKCNNNPGPGAYDAQKQVTKDKARTFSIGNEQRLTSFSPTKNSQAMPGPGMYEQRDTSPKKAFTFGGKEKANYNSNPGPGAYDAAPNATKDSTRTYAIGKSPRKTQFGNQQDDQSLPGPGMYERIESPNSKAYTMGGKAKTKFNDNPGPGSYDANPNKTKDAARTFGIGSEKRTLLAVGREDEQGRPGPGMYEVQGTNSAKAFTMGNKIENKYNNNPGPGAYDPSPEKIKDSTRTYAIGGEKRATQFGQSQGEDMPGPGMYQEANTNDGKAFTIGGKVQDKYNQNPGPGSYDFSPERLKDSTRTYAIGKEKRSTQFGQAKGDEDLPGPGMYREPETNDKKSYTFGQKTEEKYNQNPGPGAYNASPEKTKDSTRTYAIGNEKRTTQFGQAADGDLPGPGMYRETTTNDGKAFTMGAKQQEKYNQNPGPGSYDAAHEFVKDSQRTFGMGTEKRNTQFGYVETQDLPGPGMYQESTTNDGKAFTIQGKQQEKYNQNPGPGSYDNQNQQMVRDATRSYPIGTEKRNTQFGNQQNQDDLPGPGMYEASSTNSGKAFVIQGKQEEKYNQNPGPGAYNASPDKVKDSTRTYAIGSEKRQTQFGQDQAGNDLPGPGMYEEMSTNTGKAFTITGKQQEKYNQNPGPGAYDASPEKLKDSTRTYAIGSEKRNTQFGQQQQEDMPGPGMYEESSTNQGKAFTIGGKVEEKYNQNPGPGAYNASPDKVKDSTRTYAIGSEKRTTQFENAGKNEMPGPGMYEEQNTNSGKAFTMGTKQQEKYNQNPGPGQYDANPNNVKDATRTYAIGNEKRNTQFGYENQGADLPGPGMYEAAGTNSGKAFKMGERQQEQYNQNPGPGAYDPSPERTKDSTRTYALGNEKRNTQFGMEGQNDINVGPGMYENQTTNDGKAYTIGSKQAEQYNKNPGPGAYDPSPEKVKDSTRTYAIGSEKRNTQFGVEGQNDTNVGPGMYENQSTNDGKAYTIGSKQAEQYNKNPGPGAYDPSPEKVKDSTRTYAIGSEKRNTQFGLEGQNDVNVGPGMYENQSTNDGKAYTIGSKQAEQYNKNPGPGAYDPSPEKIKDSTRAYAIGGEKRNTQFGVEGQNDVNVGPGMYEDQSTNNGKAYTIGGKQAEQYNKNPGPGAYDPSPEKIKDSTRAYAIGSEKRNTQFGVEGQNDVNVGPGMYEDQNTNNGKAYTIGGKQAEQYNKNPGPGAYDPSPERTKDSTRTYVIGNEKRNTQFGQEGQKDNVGPGMYQEQSTNDGKAYTIGGKVTEQYNKNPGPGAYDPSPERTKDSTRAYAIGGEKRTTQFGQEGQNDNVGPGMYEEQNTNNGKAFTFSGKQQEQYNQNPGPGAYNANSNNTKDSARAYAIGGEKRNTQFGSQGDLSIPGPGMYEETKTNEGKAFAFTGKQQEVYNQNPGPGQYNASPERVKDSTRTYTIGGEKRDTQFGLNQGKDANDLPGPGMYEGQDLNNKQAYSIQGKQQEKYNQNPGPGQYNANPIVTKDAAREFSMGNEKRNTQFNVQSDNQTGPGMYDGANLDEGPSYTIQGKQQEKFNQNPGPGAYDAKIDQTKDKIQDVIIGNERRIEQHEGGGQQNTNFSQSSPGKQSRTQLVKSPGSNNSNNYNSNNKQSKQMSGGSGSATKTMHKSNQSQGSQGSFTKGSPSKINTNSAQKNSSKDSQQKTNTNSNQKMQGNASSSSFSNKKQGGETTQGKGYTSTSGKVSGQESGRASGQSSSTKQKYISGSGSGAGAGTGAKQGASGSQQQQLGSGQKSSTTGNKSGGALATGGSGSGQNYQGSSGSGQQNAQGNNQGTSYGGAQGYQQTSGSSNTAGGYNQNKISSGGTSGGASGGTSGGGSGAVSGGASGGASGQVISNISGNEGSSYNSDLGNKGASGNNQASEQNISLKYNAGSGQNINSGQNMGSGQYMSSGQNMGTGQNMSSGQNLGSGQSSGSGYNQISGQNSGSGYNQNYTQNAGSTAGQRSSGDQIIRQGSGDTKTYKQGGSMTSGSGATYNQGVVGGSGKGGVQISSGSQEQSSQKQGGSFGQGESTKQGVSGSSQGGNIQSSSQNTQGQVIYQQHQKPGHQTTGGQQYQVYQQDQQHPQAQQDQEEYEEYEEYEEVPDQKQ